ALALLLSRLRRGAVRVLPQLLLDTARREAVAVLCRRNRERGRRSEKQRSADDRTDGDFLQSHKWSPYHLLWPPCRNPRSRTFPWTRFLRDPRLDPLSAGRKTVPDVYVFSQLRDSSEAH